MVDTSRWSKCMKDLHLQDPSLNEDELREECEGRDINKSFHEATNNLEEMMGAMGMMGLMLGVTSLFNELPSQDKTTIIEGGTFQGMDISETMIGEDIMQIEMTLPLDQTLPAEAYNQVFSEQELNQFAQMAEEYKQYGRMMDPQTVEYKEWQNMENILEQVGQFGYHESTVQSELSVYTQYDVMIPWTTCEDNDSCDTDGPVCEDCESLRGELYPPDNFPEPPHYKCRCNEPMADPEYVGGDSWQQFS